MAAFPKSLLKSLQSFRPTQIAVLAFLLLLVIFGTLPSYFTGRWSWAYPPKVTVLQQLKTLKNQPLFVPGWQTLNHQPIPVSGRNWILQELRQQTADQLGGRPAVAAVVLLPQSGDKVQPQVEWTDFDAFQRWTADSRSHLRFTVTAADAHTTQPRQATVEAQFFRGWTKQQTFAVVQWYAWPEGGSPNLEGWFWADRRAQLQRQRSPWIAVCILIPMEPLGEIETVRPVAESLAKTLQMSLMTGPFQELPAKNK